MKAVFITPKNQGEFKFINDLLKKLGISSATMAEAELEDIDLSTLLKAVDKATRVNKKSIMQKLKKMQVGFFKVNFQKTLITSRSNQPKPIYPN